MTYENLVKEAKKAVKTVDAKSIKEHLAVEFDIEGKGEGAFYVEFDGKGAEVEPYEYYDHDFRLRTTGDVALKVLSGELDPEKAAEEGLIAVEGDAGKLSLLKKLLEVEKAEEPKKATAKKPVPKKTEKKPAAKKAVTKKATVKK
ncbi:MAG: SCP2 sterol-binding domain-containing protein [Butyrivibrio sp.]|nr:SCP2 sterol-binding domain-containing protein [Butyrivibrio sp.]